MICKPCAVAGDMVAVVREKPVLNVPLNLGSFAGIDSIESHEAIRAVAYLYHGLCKGCDCQHKIDFEGKTVNEKA